MEVEVQLHSFVISALDGGEWWSSWLGHGAVPGSLREEKKSIASVGSVTLDRPTDSLANKKAVSARLSKCRPRSGLNMHFYDHNNNAELLCQLPHEQLFTDSH